MVWPDFYRGFGRTPIAGLAEAPVVVRTDPPAETNDTQTQPLAAIRNQTGAVTSIDEHSRQPSQTTESSPTRANRPGVQFPKATQTPMSERSRRDWGLSQGCPEPPLDGRGDRARAEDRPTRRQIAGSAH
jgi:hypothetical protein